MRSKIFGCTYQKKLSKIPCSSSTCSQGYAWLRLGTFGSPSCLLRTTSCYIFSRCWRLILAGRRILVFTMSTALPCTDLEWRNRVGDWNCRPFPQNPLLEHHLSRWVALQLCEVGTLRSKEGLFSVHSGYPAFIRAVYEFEVAEPAWSFLAGQSAVFQKHAIV